MYLYDFPKFVFYIHNNPKRLILLCNVAEYKATCIFCLYCTIHMIVSSYTNFLVKS